MDTKEALCICAEAAQLRSEMWSENADGGFLTGSAVLDCFAESDATESLSMAARLTEASSMLGLLLRCPWLLGRLANDAAALRRHHPAVTHPNNKLRIESAGVALGSYIVDAGGDKRSAVIDLLTDLLHYAHDSTDIEFSECVGMAEIHFEEEVEDEIQQ